MKFAEYFVKHPVFAIVLNCMILIMGSLCLHHISVREYPEVKLPVFTVSAEFPNASSELIESTVTHALEDQLGGIEGLDYMTSDSMQGHCQITLRFKEGTPIDRTLQAMRDAINLARSYLPKEVPEPIIQRSHQTDGFPFIAIAITSPESNYGELTHYANLYLKNAFRNISGVSSVEVHGQPYTMEISLDPKKLYAFGVNADEVYSAVEMQTRAWPVGKYRDKVPSAIEAPLSKAEDFNDIFIKNRPNGSAIYLHSVGEVSLTTNNKSFSVRINGKPGLILAIEKASDANPLDVSKLIHKQVKALQETISPDLKMEIILDQTDFIQASLHNIRTSIIEAVVLVLIIVFVFLRNVSSTLIPLITIPISLVGSLIFLKLFGFSINTLTLLAMMLAIGLVVDDAIVVLENIARRLEEGLSPIQAAIEGSREIAFAVIAMTLTLASVYLPLAFIQGTIGQLFIEFAVALAGSVLISGVVALTLAPMMCSKILQKANPTKNIHSSFFVKIQQMYQQGLEIILNKNGLLLGVTVSIIFGLCLLYHVLPKETLAKEDRGFLGVFVPPIPGNDMATFDSIVSKVEAKLNNIPEARVFLTYMGEWGASICIPLKDHKQRKRSAQEIVKALEPSMMALPSIDAWPWSWNSGLPGMDDAMSGDELSLAVTTVGNYGPLLRNLNEAREAIEERSIFQSAHHDLKLDSPGYNINVDPISLARSGLNTFQVSKMIEIFFSGSQSLSFNKEGIRYPITIKGDSMPWTLDELYLTTQKGQKVSLGTLASMESTTPPKEIHHHNQMRSATLTTSLHGNLTLESAMQELLKIVNKVIPGEYKKEWIGSAREFQESASTMLLLLFLAVIFIYAILAIQFDNFIDPLIIMFTVPLGCFGALLTAYLFHQSLNIYTQIGLITLIGLITKHGILIVEFANQKRKQGLSLQHAVMEAAVLRLRPILMTTAAMILGAIPLIMAGGAGAEARQAIGFILVGGLLFGTLLTLFGLPFVYYHVKKLTFLQFLPSKQARFIDKSEATQHQMKIGRV